MPDDKRYAIRRNDGKVFEWLRSYEKIPHIVRSVTGYYEDGKLIITSGQAEELPEVEIKTDTPELLTEVSDTESGKPYPLVDDQEEIEEEEELEEEVKPTSALGAIAKPVVKETKKETKAKAKKTTGKKRGK